MASPYVPYDTAILADFSDTIKAYIGQAVPIAVTCFAMLVGIILVVSLVRR